MGWGGVWNQPSRETPDPQMTPGNETVEAKSSDCSFRDQCELLKQWGDRKRRELFPLPSRGGGSSGHPAVQTAGWAPSREPQQGTLGAGLVGAAVRFGRHISGQGAFLAECCIPNLQTPAHVVQR